MFVEPAELWGVSSYRAPAHVSPPPGEPPPSRLFGHLVLNQPLHCALSHSSTFMEESFYLKPSDAKGTLITVFNL